MDTDGPLYNRDPEAWAAHLAEGNARQPRKRVAVDILIRDHEQRVLLVDPTYKPHWDLPGGMVETNEAPRAAARRELTEELGLLIQPGRALCIEWVPPHHPWDDSLAFIFDGGTIDRDTTIDLDTGELLAYQFTDPHRAVELVRPRLARRLTAAMTAVTEGRTIYLEPDGTTP